MRIDVDFHVDSGINPSDNPGEGDRAKSSQIEADRDNTLSCIVL
jgi:hypothetical protein